MRITQIDVKNFRAFYGSHALKLDSSGKNALIYGENGSGKSSLALAITTFLNAYNRQLSFSLYRNIFMPDVWEGYIKFHIKDESTANTTIYKWQHGSNYSSETFPNETLILDAAKSSGFLNYQSLLRTHFLPSELESVNIFDLIVCSIFSNITNTYTGNTFGDDWNDIKNSIPDRNISSKVDQINAKIQDFNRGLASKLVELKNKTIDIFNRFRYPVALDFEFTGVLYNRTQKRIDNQRILVKADFFNKPIDYHHQFLNESKLSAIAVSLYFAALLLTPQSDLRVLVLDDVLIGLDMSNRMPVIKILEDYFSEFQIFFLTYDKEWFEIIKRHTKSDQWKYFEFFYPKGVEYELPVFAEDRKYLERAKEFFSQNEYRAAAIYLRTAFEDILKRFCKKKRISVRFVEKIKDLTTDDFWNPIKDEQNPDGTPKFVDASLTNEVESCRSLIMNPLSHSQVVCVYSQEIEDAINIVERLENTLFP